MQIGLSLKIPSHSLDSILHKSTVNYFLLVGQHPVGPHNSPSSTLPCSCLQKGNKMYSRVEREEIILSKKYKMYKMFRTAKLTAQQLGGVIYLFYNKAKLNHQIVLVIC
jgi:hypothetical protein